MGPLEISTIVVASLIVLSYFSIEIYRRFKGKPSINEGCGYKHIGKSLVKAYHKQKAKELKKQKKAEEKQKS